MRAEKHPGRRDVGGQRFALLGTYSVRIMLGLAASLLVALLCFRLPVHAPVPGVSWGPAPIGPPIALKDLREMEEEEAGGQEMGGAPLSAFGATEQPGEDAPERGASGPAADTASGRGEADASERKQRTPLSELPGTVQLHTLDQAPQPVGGVRGVYLKIDYPEAARRDSIEGRLLLHFIVEEDGATSNVRVAQSLHPLCDSAAVRAVERTRFIPGQRGGKPVRVPIHLPVRFELVSRTPPRPARAPADADVDTAAP